MLRGTWYYNKEIKVENGEESAKIGTNVQTFRDFALHMSPVTRLTRLLDQILLSVRM